MSTYPLNWYALIVKPRHEKAVLTALRGKGFTALLPIYEHQHHSAGRVRTSLVPLFPTYVFCRMDPLVRLPILMIPGVRSIVSGGNAPTPVDETEIAALTSLIESGLPIQPEPFIEIGDLVYIQGGPLRGLEGKLIECRGQYRLVISVTLLRRSVSVEIPRQSVRPVLSRPANIRPGAYSIQGGPGQAADGCAAD